MNRQERLRELLDKLEHARGMVELLQRRLDLKMSSWTEEDAALLPEIRLRMRATELGMPATGDITQVRDFLKAYVLTNVPVYSAAIVLEDQENRS